MFFSLCRPCDELASSPGFNPSLSSNSDPECRMSIDGKWMDGQMLWEVLDQRGAAAAVHICTE